MSQSKDNMAEDDMGYQLNRKLIYHCGAFKPWAESKHFLCKETRYAPQSTHVHTRTQEHSLHTITIQKDHENSTDWR